ncbi:MAG TPA: FMN-binding protein [Chthoniobacterales bacterium]|nr:FMN-binding protein [Chthoniobacterales bacterium]
MKDWIPFLAIPLTAASTAVPGFANTYLTVEQAQQTIFPGASFTPVPKTLTPDQQKTIESRARVGVRSRDLKVWKVSNGGWFIVDQVLGKHEYITYALGLTATGAVKQIEILDYRETYGYQVRDESWRQQFVGKTAESPLNLDRDIRNISGATLSSRHITDGVRRLLVTYDVALR